MSFRAQLLVVVCTTLLACGASSSGPTGGGPAPLGQAGAGGSGGSGGGGGGASSSACDQQCLDGIALRAVRLTLKAVFNHASNGAPIGDLDATTDCPGGGTAHVVGTTSSTAAQGGTTIDVTYDLAACLYGETSLTATKTFAVSSTGKITEQGMLGVQPGATTTLTFAGTGLTLTGTVYDPPLSYSTQMCSLSATQTGNAVSGVLCGRPAAFGF